MKLPKFSLIVAICGLLVFLHYSASYAQSTPPYMANVKDHQTGSEPRTFIPKIWSQDGARNAAKWKNFLPSGSDTFVTTAFNQWGGLDGAPIFLNGQKVTSGSANLTLSISNQCSSGYACYIALAFSDDTTRSAMNVTDGRIYFPGYYDSLVDDAERQFVISHELGHYLGLADRYTGSSTCDNSAPASIMQARTCTGSSAVPTTTGDSDMLRNLYKFCDRLYSWCGNFDYHFAVYMPDGDIKVRLKVNAWNTYWGQYSWYVNYGDQNWFYSEEDLEANNVGFWYDGVFYGGSYNGDENVTDVILDNPAGKYGSGNKVMLCGWPWTLKYSGSFLNPNQSNGYYGRWKCFGAITIQ